MTYPEAVKYLESFINYEKISAYPYKESLKLERIRGFLDTIGNPQKDLKCIHIAGTKGKGSTCVFLAYILRQAGFKVGLYTSPHLADFKERIRVLRVRKQAKRENRHGAKDFEGMIRRQELAYLIERLKPTIEKLNKRSEYGPLSFFEVYTAAAFAYFKEQKVDFAVLETGLGGRLDATNAVDALISVITPISYEHTDKLGNTLVQIAREKAGIIKKCQSVKVSKCHGVVICAPQEKEVLDVIRNRCKTQGARLLEIGRDILITDYRLCRSIGIPQRYFKESLHSGPITDYSFKIKGVFKEYTNLKIRLLGKHQLINASVAVGVIEALRFYNINVDTDSIRVGLYDTVWPARCEVISRNPLIVLDGAQNVASVAALKKALRDNFRYKKLILVLGISQDKDINGICSQLYELADTVILTRANNPRAILPAELVKYFRGRGTHVTVSVKEARKKALHLAQKEDLILVCGSLFVVGEFRNDELRYQ